MLSRDFSETFNAAVNARDWPLVVVLGESAVAENEASPDVLYNLGLAYMNTNKPAMAVSVFVSVPARDQDANFVSARNDALRMVDATAEDLDLGAHGMTGVVVGAANTMKALDPVSWCVVSLGVLLLISLGFAFLNDRIKGRLSRLIVKIAFSVSTVVTLVTGIAAGFAYFYQSHWGAVIAANGSVMRVNPGPESEAIKELRQGTPVLVLGDETSPWVRVVESGGGSGWMNAFELRVIRQREGL